MIQEKNRITIDKVPVDMAKCPAWICWRKEERNGRIAKIPIDPKNGCKGDVTDLSICTTFDNAIKSCERYNLDGIGFVFHREHQFVGVDVDHCVNEKGQLSEEAQNIVNTLDSYTELSPSKTGIHIICKGVLPQGERRNAEYGIEMYDDKRYFTFTAYGIGGNYVGERSDELKDVHNRYLKKIKTCEKKPLITQGYGSILDDGELIRKATLSKHGQKFQDLYNGSWEGYYKSQSEAELAFCNMLAFWTAKDRGKIDRILRQSRLYRGKWDEKHHTDGKTYGQATIELAIDSCNSIYQPVDKRTNPKIINSSKVSEPIEVKQKITEPEVATNQSYEWYLESNGNVTFLPGVLAQHLYKKVTSLSANGIFYIYKQGVYREISNDEVMKIIQDMLIDRYSKVNHVKDVFGQWKNKAHINADCLNSGENAHIINFENGLFNVNDKTLKEHTPEHLSTVQLKCNYNQDAKCDNFLNFMNQSLHSDSVILAQEIMGYMLVPFTAAQKAFIFYGPPRTGKSTLLRVLENIIGKENISNIPWQDLNGEFKTAVLDGKLINIFADLPSKPLEDCGIFKSLTGEDTVTGQLKYQNSYSFINKARLLFSCNELPRNYGDKTDAFYRRLVILLFDHQISDNQIDTKLSGKLLEEKEGIVQWALQGLYRLMSHDYRFSESTETKRVIEKYKIESDTVLWFIDNYCKIVPNSVVNSKLLFATYKETCMENGLGALSQIKFNNAIETNYRNIITRTKEVNSRRVIYKGIAILMD